MSGSVDMVYECMSGPAAPTESIRVLLISFRLQASGTPLVLPTSDVSVAYGVWRMAYASTVWCMLVPVVLFGVC
jgi:hypothetical protein